MPTKANPEHSAEEKKDETHNAEEDENGTEEVTLTDSLEGVVEDSPLVTLLGTHAKVKILRTLLVSHPTPLNPSKIIELSTLSSRDCWYDHKDELLETGLVVQKTSAGNSPLYGLAENDERVRSLQILKDYTHSEN